MSKLLQIISVAKKEYSDALKNRVFLTFLFFLLTLTVISLVIGSLDFQSKVSIYQKAYNQLIRSGQAAGNLTKPQFFPLQLLRGTIEYLEIIGAIMAIALGYLAIAKEKGNNTLQLILTRPITRATFFLGKLAGNFLLLASVCASVFAVIILILSFIGGAGLNTLEIAKIISAFFFSVVYLSIFFSLSATLALWFRSLPAALIVSFVIWILFVLIVPQIGDTMDTDNQVPGGFFNAIHVDNQQSKIILKQFSAYEALRNGLEEASITKHYERLTFALLGIKNIYNDKSLSFIYGDKLNELIWLVSFLLGLSATSILVFNRKQTLWKKDV